MQFTNFNEEDNKNIAAASKFLEECCCFLMSVSENIKNKDNDKYLHSTLTLMLRSLIVKIYGMSNSVDSVENFAILLRSAFEQTMNILYILESDSSRRAIAFQFCHAIRRIEWYKKLDTTSKIGQSMRNKLKGDSLVDVFDCILTPAIIAEKIQNIQNFIDKSEHAEIKQSFSSMKNPFPKWYSCFNGPKNTSALSIHLGLGVLYEYYYDVTSRIIHGEDVMDSINYNSETDVCTILPIQNSKSISSLIPFVVEICDNLQRSLIKKYNADSFKIYDDGIRKLLELQKNLNLKIGNNSR